MSAIKDGNYNVIECLLFIIIIKYLKCDSGMWYSYLLIKISEGLTALIVEFTDGCDTEL